MDLLEEDPTMNPTMDRPSSSASLTNDLQLFNYRLQQAGQLKVRKNEHG